MVHGEFGGPFLAYRVEAEGRVIAYSADTEWTETLIPLGRDADLFIAEAYNYDRIVKNHLSLKRWRRTCSRDQGRSDWCSRI